MTDHEVVLISEGLRVSQAAGLRSVQSAAPPVCVCVFVDKLTLRDLCDLYTATIIKPVSVHIIFIRVIIEPEYLNLSWYR